MDGVLQPKLCLSPTPPLSAFPAMSRVRREFSFCFIQNYKPVPTDWLGSWMNFVTEFDSYEFSIY